ncbi:MAG: hypothetical protein AAF974_07935 [Cyanobacteria bacterium P01_E01_bin.34]
MNTIERNQDLLRTVCSISTPSNRGQSLLEVVFSTLILFIGVTGVSSGFLGFTLQNRKTELSTGAVSAARTVLDRLRLEDIATLPDGGDRQICNPADDYVCQNFNSALIDVGSVVLTFCPDFANDLEYCTPTNSSLRHILVEVYENDGEGGAEITFSAETVFSELRDL